MKPLELTGLTFGRLTAIKRVGIYGSSSKSYGWLCRCKCGNEKIVLATRLKRGVTKSCGCLQREIAKSSGDRARTHGASKTTTYNIWSSMMQRCGNPSAKDYHRYGGKGIKVCKDWQTFDGFFADMGHRPAGMSLDRIDNDLGYNASNCRWANAKTQQRNKNNNRLITYAGRTATLAEWAEAKGINKNTLHARLVKGWPVSRALSDAVCAKYSHQKNRKGV